MSKRKREHIELAFRSQTTAVEVDPRFIYEPLLSGHPTGLVAKTFLGRTFRTPIWACSMTGGTHFAKRTNENIARICRDFGMGMGKQSLERLLQLPLQAVEFGAFGGTNFSKVELQRREYATCRIRPGVGHIEIRQTKLRRFIHLHRNAKQRSGTRRSISPHQY